MRQRYSNVISKKDATDQPYQFNSIMHQLCKGAPQVAQAIAGAIQEEKISSPELQGPKLREATHSSKRRRSLVVDPSYRPSKSAKREVDCCSGNADGSNRQRDFDPVQKITTSHAKELARVDEESLDEGNRIRVVLSAPPSYHNSAQDDTRDGRKAVHWESISLENVNVVAKPSGATSTSSGCVTLTTREIPAPSPGRSSPSTAVAKTDPITSEKLADGRSSPRTDEMQRERIPGALGITNASISPAPAKTAFKELILLVVKTIYQFCNYQDGPPHATCQRILQSLKDGGFEERKASSTSEWSDGSTWMRILDMGSSQQNKVTVLNMLMYIGAWEWFDRQVNYVQGNVRTKKNKLIGEKKAKTHVLNKMQDSLQDSRPQPAAQEKWFSRVGTVTLEENASGILPRDGPTGVIAMAKIQQRSRISTLLHRGKWLSTKLVKELGRGILLHPKIWDYTKMSEEKLDDWIEKTKEDTNQKLLWQILGPQLDRLVENGSPDLQAFYEDLSKKELVTEEEINEMKICYPLDSDALPPGKLEDAVMHLKKLVSSKVLGKDTLDTTDTIAVNGSMELTCDIFDRLYPRKWLDAWTIYLAMELSDKPPHIRFSISTPLEYRAEEIKKIKKIKKVKKVTSDSLDCQLVEIKKTTPLARWAEKIAEDQKEAEEELVHFCPINHNQDHFTLLEINEREKLIRHYDSLANDATRKTEIPRLVEQQFGSFGFRYMDAYYSQPRNKTMGGVAVSELSGISDACVMGSQLDHGAND
ncbi:hypothetical protein CNMCM6106_002349 [Aspergillus hiratsukae]|uniref:Ubiquitin-like protease family profile domain-containing protein n=1 Tax=Aspergillus hiratsukae TaxID=1194566 RepID=A0A8H6UWA3_9EURO|nr:hypothetical protein CNMCM6106_002349 [Aspergillus hiratsukae]